MGCFFDESIGSVTFCKSMDGFGVQKKTLVRYGGTLVLTSKRTTFSSFGRVVLFPVFYQQEKDLGKKFT